MYNGERKVEIDDVMSRGWFLWSQWTTLGILMVTWSHHFRREER